MVKIKEAYKKLFNEEPEKKVEEWRLAEKILSHWDVPKLGENLALETLFEIINHTEFPNTGTTHRVVGRAENLITEFIPELEGHDAHMDFIAYLERKHYEEQEAKKEKGEENKEFRKENKII